MAIPRRSFLGSLLTALAVGVGWKRETPCDHSWLVEHSERAFLALETEMKRINTEIAREHAR